MKTSRHQWPMLSRDSKYKKSLAWAFFFLVISMVASSLANTFATGQAGNSVPDILLSNINAINMFVIYAYGPAILAIVVIIVGFARPGAAPFMVKALALFILVRSLFVCLTHLGVPPGLYLPEHAPWFIEKYFLGGDLFFSGHTGMPFLFALMFWKDNFLRPVFLIGSIVLAVTVLAGHYHYSIDVAAAFFITPTIFILAKNAFPDDFVLLRQASE